MLTSKWNWIMSRNMMRKQILTYRLSNLFFFYLSFFFSRAWWQYEIAGQVTLFIQNQGCSQRVAGCCTPRKFTNTVRKIYTPCILTWFEASYQFVNHQEEHCRSSLWPNDRVLKFTYKNNNTNTHCVYWEMWYILFWWTYGICLYWNT